MCLFRSSICDMVVLFAPFYSCFMYDISPQQVKSRPLAKYLNQTCEVTDNIIEKCVNLTLGCSQLELEQANCGMFLYWHGHLIEVSFCFRCYFIHPFLFPFYYLFTYLFLFIWFLLLFPSFLFIWFLLVFPSFHIPYLTIL